MRKKPILDPRGQWEHPGKVTRIPSSFITMQGVPYPVYGVGNNGQSQIMYPGMDYNFGGASYVDEYPMMQKGGTNKGKEKINKLTPLFDFVPVNKPSIKRPTQSKSYNIKSASPELLKAVSDFQNMNGDDPSKIAKIISVFDKYNVPKINRPNGGIEYDFHNIDQGSKKPAPKPRLVKELIKKPTNVLRKVPYDLESSSVDATIPLTAKSLQQPVTNYSLTYRDENSPSKQRTQYLPDFESWKNFTDNVGYMSRNYSGDNSSANALMYNNYKNGGYTVTRSHDRKGKTHKVTGPDGTVKYFGDSKLGQHPNDPERKKAFYARHKKNLDSNPYFRAFARATWEDGGEIYEMQAGGQKRMTFDQWYKTVPQYKNDTSSYNLRRAYDLAPQQQLDAFVNNPEAHLYSAYENPKSGIWEFMKSRNHPTIEKELEWFNSNDPSAIQFRKKYKLDTAGDYYRYVPKRESGGQTSDDREMLEGVADMLRRVKDAKNRKEIADYMMGNFRDENVTFEPKDFLQDANVYSKGGEMIRRADGSYSRRGLWDNIREAAGSGKKPTKEMLKQERKIKGSMQNGGEKFSPNDTRLVPQFVAPAPGTFKIPTTDVERYAAQKSREIPQTIIPKPKGQSIPSKALSIAAHPMTAISYLSKGQRIPDNLEKGALNVYDYATPVLNPASSLYSGVQIPGNIKNGEYLQGGLNTLAILPAFKALPKFKSPLLNHTKDFLKQGDFKNAVYLNTLAAANAVAPIVTKSPRLNKIYKDLAYNVASSSGGISTIDAQDILKFVLRPNKEYKGLVNYADVSPTERNLLKEYIYGNQPGFEKIDLEPFGLDKYFKKYGNMNVYKLHSKIPHGENVKVSNDKFERLLKNESFDNDLKDVSFEVNDLITPVDDIAGHNVRFSKTNLPNEYDITTQDIWKFDADDYIKRWAKYRKPAEKHQAYLQAKLLEKAGKPFILMQKNRLKTLSNDEYRKHIDDIINKQIEFDFKFGGGIINKAQMGLSQKPIYDAIPVATSLAAEQSQEPSQKQMGGSFEEDYLNYLESNNNLPKNVKVPFAYNNSEYNDEQPYYKELSTVNVRRKNKNNAEIKTVTNKKSFNNPSIAQGILSSLTNRYGLDWQNKATDEELQFYKKALYNESLKPEPYTETYTKSDNTNVKKVYPKVISDEINKGDKLSNSEKRLLESQAEDRLRFDNLSAADKALYYGDVLTDVMQLGNFVPHPIGQRIGKAGNFLGSWIDGIQAARDFTNGDYGLAAVNAVSVALPSLLGSNTFRRNSKYLRPGQLLYPLSPQAGILPGAYRRVHYIEPFNNVRGMTSGNLLANRALLGTLGAETIYDSYEMGGSNEEKEIGGENYIPQFKSNYSSNNKINNMIPKAQDGWVQRAANANLNFWEKCRLATSADNGGGSFVQSGDAPKQKRYNSAYEELADLKGGYFDKDQMKEIKRTVPQGVSMDDWVAFNREAGRFNAKLSNPDYGKYTDSTGMLKPEWQSVATNFDPYYLYYKPSFVNKSRVSPEDIMNYHMSQPEGLQGFKNLVNRGYMPSKKGGGSTYADGVWYKNGGFIPEYNTGGIHINPANKGKFTESARRAGMGVQEFASHVLANKEDYSSTQVKRANFARNASKWNHEEGGDVQNDILPLIAQVAPYIFAMGGYVPPLPKAEFGTIDWNKRQKSQSSSMFSDNENRNPMYGQISTDVAAKANPQPFGVTDPILSAVGKSPYPFAVPPHEVGHPVPDSRQITGYEIANTNRNSIPSVNSKNTKPETKDNKNSKEKPPSFREMVVNTSGMYDYFKNQRKQKEARAYSRAMGMTDNINPAIPSYMSGLRGDYVQTGTAFGDFRPDEKVVNKGMYTNRFNPGVSTMQAGGDSTVFEDGGVYDLTPDQIQYILKNGGTVEFI